MNGSKLLPLTLATFANLTRRFLPVIHNCSHANSDDAHYRITDEQIFVAIFNYIEHLFSKIKPKQLFFMAVDGVAPRAKMNQQRSRRFRTAHEAKELRDKALAKGEELPDTDPFDSNCITPGTPFMAKLSEQLKYFIAKKVNEDSDWRSVQVVLSGHEVPGEGEHKIMEYIRLAKAQPDYNPNMRHCLYGLDADLIMLGLLSHDPHFCLLREEVVFGPQRKKSKGTLDSQNFYLMHLSLFREYLDLEFSSIADTPNLGFEYDLERIIDDWILLVIFVGNDFLPHMPGLHINEGALNLLYGIYKRVLPKAGGYLNEHGKLNTRRLQMVLDELCQFEQDTFEQEYADSNWFKGKQARHIEALDQARQRAKLALTSDQRGLFNQIKKYVKTAIAQPAQAGALYFPAKYPARDRRFLQDLAGELQLSIAFDEFNEQDEPVIALRLDEDALDVLQGDAEELADEIDGLDIDGQPVEVDGEWKKAIDRVLKKYDKAPTLPDHTETDFEEQYQAKLKEKMDAWKTEYYQEKMKLDYNDPSQLRQIVFRYIEGLQWVLHYYYDGVAAWGWFYDYHYAPKISDLRGVGDFEFNFELGQPFKPFEQLMGVLPDLSSKLIPTAFRDLMTDPNSPILDFYPREFAMDMNGKKQDWEAVVKIPFIDQNRLLKTMKEREPKLTTDERNRNTWGVSWKCYFSDTEDKVYPSSLPGFFPDIQHCRSVLEPFDLPVLTGLKLVKGLCEGVLLGKDAIAGFPSLHTLPHSGSLGYQSVNVFQADSKNESMVITIDASPLAKPDGSIKMEDVAAAFLNQRVYVNWPFLKEALVVGISDELFRYELDPHATGKAALISTPHRQDDLHAWRRKADRIDTTYSKRYGTILGNVEILVHVKLLKGLKLLEDGSMVKDFDSPENEQALQTVVQTISSADTRYQERAAPPLEIDFPIGTRVFFLGANPSYGCASQVIGHKNNALSMLVAYHPNDGSEPIKFKSLLHTAPASTYWPSYTVCRRVQMSALTLSKITSSLMIFGPDDSKVNAGLNLKFEAKGQKVLGYTRKGDHGWEYSEKAVNLISAYKAAFPSVVAILDQKRGSDVRDIADFFPGAKPDVQVKVIKQWMKDQGVDGLEKVPLDADQLEGDIVKLLEGLADNLTSLKKPESMKRVVINGIPRRALLKPEHATSRLGGQAFALGDRVEMVSEAGNVPLTAKGTVVGLQGVSAQGQVSSKGLIDVVWDVPFISGTTLQNRCSEFRGLAVPPDTILNVTAPQFIAHVGAPNQPMHNGRGRAAPRGRGFFTPAPDRGRGRTNYRRPYGNTRGGLDGRLSMNDYGAAARNSPAAYSTPVQQSQTQALQQTLVNGHQAMRNYHAVPPPPSLQHARPPRGRGSNHHVHGSPINGTPMDGIARGRGRARPRPRAAV